MKYNTFSCSRSMIQWITVAIILIIIVNGPAYAIDDEDLHKGISYPGVIPDFADFETPTIDPGNTASLSFTIQNRYPLNFTKKTGYSFEVKDNNMTNVSLIVEIYLYYTLEDAGRDVRSLNHRPKFIGGSDALYDTPDDVTANFRWSIIRTNETVPVKLIIDSTENTKEGTYFVRMHLNFTFNNTFFDMKSRGYFTKDQWERAQPNATDPNEYPIVGRLNLDVLEVDGLIPDTSIHLRKPIPRWPVYLGIGGIIFFALLALVFYLMDEKGKFPRAKKKLDNFSARVNNFRYRRQ